MADLDLIVPAISSGTTGPLGVAHLPRMWKKLTLAAAGFLPSDYDECGAGFDAMTLDALGISKDDAIGYVRSAKPTYMQFEAWVAQTSPNLTPAAIAKHNAAIAGYHHSDELAAKMRAASGISDASIKDAVTLNMIEDLDEIHRQVNA